MNIKSLYATPPAPSRSGSSAVRQEGDRSERSARPQLRIVRDHVVISHRARQLLEEMRQTPDAGVTINDLLGTDHLRGTRVTQVRDRMREGFYSQPEVLIEIASVLGGALATES